MPQKHQTSLPARSMMRLWLFIAAINGMIAVIAGAIGSHVLKGHISAQQTQWFDMANHYQLWHTPALLAVALLAPYMPSPKGMTMLNAAGAAFALGLLLFCGVLYNLALDGPSLLRPLAPLGGSCLIAGWLLLAISGLFVKTTR